MFKFFRKINIVDALKYFLLNNYYFIYYLLMSNKHKKYHIYVNYFIQNDSWESISHPNLFVLPKQFTNLNDVKAQMVYENFPLINKENYYLRFFLDDKSQGVKGWVDFPPNAVIPIYNEGHVYVKVLRLPKNVKMAFKSQNLNKPKETSKPKNETSPNLIFMEDNKNQQKPTQNNNTPFGQNMFSDLNKELNNLGNIHPNLNSNGALNPKIQDQKPINEENNLNLNNSNQKNSQNSINIEDWGAFTGNNGSGMKMDYNNGSNNNLNNVDPNLLNVFSNISSTPSQPIEQAPGYDFTANMQSNNGNMDPIDSVSENMPEDEIKDKVDVIIKEWSKGGEGQKNLLFLLTTLHEVWKTTDLKVPDMQTLVNDKSSVRTYYKKAMRDLHADKNRDKNFKTKYIASCLYQLLNEANSNY